LALSPLRSYFLPAWELKVLPPIMNERTLWSAARTER
jgi:hypothetical protein